MVDETNPIDVVSKGSIQIRIETNYSLIQNRIKLITTNLRYNNHD